MTKYETVLLMFYTLYTERVLTKEEIMEKCDITSLTFARYLGNIRSFLKKEMPGVEIVFEKKYKDYRLIGELPAEE